MFKLICAAIICIGAGEADVIDGDTFAARGAKFRLYGIQAPERGRPGFSEASIALANLISDQRLACEPRGASYDRYVVRCETADGRDLGCELVRQGHASEWARYSDARYAECEPE